MKWRILIFCPGKKKKLHDAWIEYFHHTTTRESVITWAKLMSNAPAQFSIEAHPMHLGGAK